MNNNVKLIIAACLLTVCCLPACKKKEDAKHAPDITNFSVSAPSPFIKGNPGTVQVSSTSLAAGTYVLRYKCIGGNDLGNQTTTLTMSNHVGTFQTPRLDTIGGTLAVLSSITNSDSLTTQIVTNNIATLSDSSGLMTATVAGTPFRAVSIYVDSANGRLNIGGTYYIPGTGSYNMIYMFVSPYANSTGTFKIVNHFFGSGGAVYETSGPTGTKDNQVLYGQIDITGTSPKLTGSFSFTCDDSTKISGSFSGPMP